MTKKEEILINRLEVDEDYLLKNKHEISPKEAFDCMDEYGKYCAEIAYDSSLYEFHDFETWWNEFKKTEQ